VLVYRTDRFARNKYDSAVYKQKFWENGIEIRYAAEAMPEGPEGIILESLMEGLNEDWAAYKKRIIDCFVSQVYLYDNKILIYYNISRDGKTRLETDLPALEDAMEHEFNACSTKSTKRLTKKMQGL